MAKLYSSPFWSCNIGYVRTLPENRHWQEEWEHEVDVSVGTAGSTLLSVIVDGESIEASPTILGVEEPRCEGERSGLGSNPVWCILPASSACHVGQDVYYIPRRSHTDRWCALESTLSLDETLGIQGVACYIYTLAKNATVFISYRDDNKGAINRPSCDQFGEPRRNDQRLNNF